MTTVDPWRSRIVRTGKADPRSLRANPKNWRTHPPEQRAALAEMLATVGYVQSVVVNRTTGNLVDGHLRVELAAERGERRIPVVYVELTEEEEARVLASLDPLSAMATIDTDRLGSLLREMTMDDDALSAMLADLARKAKIDLSPAASPADPNATPEPEESPYVQRGEVYSLAQHRIMCGDSTLAADVQRLLGTSAPTLMVTDPPYGMALDTDWSGVVGSLKSAGHGTPGGKYARVIGDDAPFDPAHLFDGTWPFAREMFLFGADYYAERIPGRVEGSWLVWDKRKESQSDAIGAEFELCWSRVRHKRRMLRHDWFGFSSSSNPVEARNRIHPTQKPTSLIEDIISQWGGGETSVVDPYSGSGTTIIAAERTGKQCFAMEIDPRYVQIAITRWEQYTGQKAERV